MPVKRLGRMRSLGPVMVAPLDRRQPAVLIDEKRGVFLGHSFIRREFINPFALQGAVLSVQVSVAKARPKENITVVAGHQDMT